MNRPGALAGAATRPWTSCTALASAAAALPGPFLLLHVAAETWPHVVTGAAAAARATPERINADCSVSASSRVPTARTES